MESLLKLNLGCGEHHKDGYINVDKYGSPDILHDLEDGYYDSVVLGGLLDAGSSPA